jgi:hypothetical protein
MTTPRRGRPPKPPDEVRTVRVTVLLTEREHTTLLRACGGRGVATLLASAGLREAEAMGPKKQAFIGNPARNGWTDTSPHFIEPAIEEGDQVVHVGCPGEFRETVTRVLGNTIETEIEGQRRQVAPRDMLKVVSKAQKP